MRYWHWLTARAARATSATSIALRQERQHADRRARIGDDARARALRVGDDPAARASGSGVLAGAAPRRRSTRACSSATTVFAALPAFVAAIVLISVFAVKLGWFPALGTGDGLPRPHLAPHAAGDRARAVGDGDRRARDAGQRARARSAREHVQTAVSRGLPSRLVVRRHVLRNAAIPITTVGGHHDRVADRAGGGRRAGVQPQRPRRLPRRAAALSKDFAVVQGISLVLVAAFVVTNTIVDLLYALLDPRVALGSAGRMSGVARHSRPRRGAARRRARRIAGQRHGRRSAMPASSSGSPLACARSSVRLLAPHDPNASNLNDAYVGPVGRPPARASTARAATSLSRLLAGARTSMLGPLIVVAAGDRRRRARSRSSPPGAAAGSTRRSRSVLDILFAFPGDPARRARRRRVRPEPDGRRARARRRLHARTSRASCAARRCASARSEYIAALRGPGPVRRGDLRAPPRAERDPADRRPGARSLFGYAMVDLAAISFIGLGVQPPQPTGA